MAAKILYFLKMFFYPKSLVLEYKVLVAINIIIPGYYRFNGNKCLFGL